MANDIGWGQGSINNTNGWGQGANNSNGWGKVQLSSYSGETEIDGGNIPTNTVAPSITGTAKVGQVVSCSTGTWSGIPTYTYQWYRGASVISGATNSDYILVTDDIGANVKCVVTATNFIGTATADSNTIVPTASTDADAQAFITAASITDATQQSAINQLVVDLKGYSIWTKMKAIYPFVGGTASTHKYNLKDPRDLDAAYRLVFSGGWTHSNNGATGNGTNAYADTKLNPFINLSQNSAHNAHYFRTALSTNNQGYGVIKSDYTERMDLLNYGAIFSTIGAQGQAFSSSTPYNSLICTSRISLTSNKLYKAGILLNTQTTLLTSNLPNNNYYLASINQAPGNWYASNQIAFSSIGDGLTDTEASNLYTAVQTFQTTLGRQV